LMGVKRPNPKKKIMIQRGGEDTNTHEQKVGYIF